MRQFTVYETNTGNVLKVLTQSKEPVLKEGQSFIEGNYPDDQFDIVDGEPAANLKDIVTPAPPTLVSLSKDEEAHHHTPEEDVRFQRNVLLQESDWTQLPDANVDRQAWATYRQALRSVPQQESFPDNVIWPTPPTE